MSLEATAEDRQRFCSRDVLWQIVPDTRGSNRKSPVADGQAAGQADDPRCTDEVGLVAGGVANN